MTPSGRQRTQNAARVAGLVFVIAWLLSASLQATIPFWLPFAILAVTELDFLARGLRERRAQQPRELPEGVLERRLPGRDDADLGWVEAVDEEGLPVLVPAPPAAARPRRGLFLALGAAVAVVLFVLALRVDSGETWQSLDPEMRAAFERHVTAAAGTIAGRAVEIRCDEEYAFTGAGSDAAGVAFIRRGLAFLAPSVCLSLHDIMTREEVRNREAAAFALTVLAHEATHLRGIRDEAVTECYALQEGSRLGARLGLPSRTARDLMRAQLERDLSDRSVERLGYRIPAGCRNGGGLDLRPDDPVFP